MILCNRYEESRAGELISAMPYSSIEPRVTDDYLSRFGDSYYIAGMYEDCTSLLEALCHPCPMSDSSSPLQEDYFHHGRYLLCSEGVHSANSPFEEKQLPYSGWSSSDNEYESCFSFGVCWYDNIDNNACAGGVDKAEESSPSEEQRDSYLNHYYENAEDQISSDDRPWFGYESRFECGREENPEYPSSQEPRHVTNYDRDEIRFYEGIFGYWPCLMQKHRNACW